MQEQTACRSVFKSGGKPDAKRYTQIWADFINRAERSKAVSPVKLR